MTHTTDAQRLDRRLRALQMRQSGMSYRQIAAALGVSATLAHRDIRREMRAVQALVRETATESVAIEIERLDDMFCEAWPAAQQGDLRALSRSLQIVARRARLLGIDAVIRQDLAHVE